MTVRLIRKPPIGQVRTERLKLILEGNHSLEEKICMLMQGIAYLEHKHGIYRAGLCDLYLAPIDRDGYPLTALPEGQLISDYNLAIDGPYQCAADFYRAG